MVKLYNTFSRSVEEFIPINPPSVAMYSCGPTVYDYQHIGHMRRYIGDDVLVRILRFNGYDVTHMMNITDVGHLVSDADEGEDKMEKGARKFGKSVWDIAKMFEKQFVESCKELNIQLPKDFLHATDYIKEQIAFIQILDEKGFTYKINDGIYFDTSKFPGYFTLSHQNPKELKSGARVEMAEGKKHLTDFALWKFSPKSQKRQMEWKSPWGVGFPGWHIECSAMSLEGLFHVFQHGRFMENKVRTIDIHTGGIDHIAIHHTNEIAQAEGATGKKFVNYWVHHNFLLVDGQKMSKSLGNIYTVQDVIAKGFDPMSLRYLYLQTHYRQEMNFTWESLEAAEKALRRLRGEIVESNVLPIGCAEFEKKFLDAVNDDMNIAQALAIVWELIKSDYPASAKRASLLKFDQVLGLELTKKDNDERKKKKIPKEVLDLVKEREEFRKKKEYKKSDQLREKIQEMGYDIKDTEKGPELTQR